MRSPAYFPPSARTEFSSRARSAWGRPVDEIWIIWNAPANCGRTRAPKAVVLAPSHLEGWV